MFGHLEHLLPPAESQRVSLMLASEAKTRPEPAVVRFQPLCPCSGGGGGAKTVGCPVKTFCNVIIFPCFLLHIRSRWAEL